MAATDHVHLFSHSVFSPPADAPDLVEACPTMDLTASVSEGNTVYVRRRGGEIVSKFSERNKDVEAVAWKADGKYLAIAWNDGVVRLVGLEGSKSVNQMHLFSDEQSPSKVTFIRWAKSRVGSPESWQGHRRGEAAEESQTGFEDQTVADLPRALTFLEVEDDLPKLQPLPVSGGSGEDMFVFSTRTSLEFLFPRLKPNDGDTVHVMVLATADGTIHVSVFDTFVMGTFHLGLPSSPSPSSLSPPPKNPLHLRRHASHPASSTHALLLANEERDSHAFYLVPMDLAFIYASPLNLSLVAFKANTFQKLARYIKQTQIHMQGEWQAARELPARFLAGIQEDLREKEPKHKRIDHALRVAALTGYVSPTLKEWLVDTIAERGHKRWDKAVLSGLENLRDLLHENLLPALDRAMLALSRLRGLALFSQDTGSNNDIGFTASALEQVMDTTSCLLLAAHNALRLVTAELELFMSFSVWLRQLIERLALPGQAEEQADKEPFVTITPVADYISNHLLQSPLELHFGKASEADWEADWAVATACSSKDGGGGDGTLMALLETELAKVDSLDAEPDMLGMLQQEPQRQRRRPLGGGKGKQREGSQIQGQDEKIDVPPSPLLMKAFPQFAFLTKLFSEQADGVLKDIAESGRKHVHFGPMTRLAVGAPVKRSAVGVTAIWQEGQEDSADVLAFTALVTKEQPTEVSLFRTDIQTSAGVSRAAPTQACRLRLGGDDNDDDSVIADIQLLRADLLLVLWTTSRKDGHRPPRLVAIPLQSSQLPFAPYSADADTGLEALPHVAIDPSQSNPTRDGGGGLFQVVDLESTTMPQPNSPVVRMQVLDSGANKGETRVCLQYGDGTTYRVFAVPSWKEMGDA